MRLQESMLLEPTATRMNFWATKLTSFVAFEQENIPTASGPPRSIACRNPAAARSSASSHDAGTSSPPGDGGVPHKRVSPRLRRTNGCVIREYLMLLPYRPFLCAIPPGFAHRGDE